jgi:hypothetical protein
MLGAPCSPRLVNVTNPAANAGAFQHRSSCTQQVASAPLSLIDSPMCSRMTCNGFKSNRARSLSVTAVSSTGCNSFLSGQIVGQCDGIVRERVVASGEQQHR